MYIVKSDFYTGQWIYFNYVRMYLEILCLLFVITYKKYFSKFL